MTVAARSRTTSIAILAGLALTMVGLSTPQPASGAHPAGADERVAGPSRPVLTYAGAKNVVVLDQHGTVLSRVPRVPRVIGGFSLGGGLLAKGYAGASATRTVGYDARDGERLFRIGDTLLIPTVVGRQGVAFSGQGERDPYASDGCRT